MNKRIVLVAVLLVNVLGVVSGVNFMRRINEKYWINGECELFSVNLVGCGKKD